MRSRSERERRAKGEIEREWERRLFSQLQGGRFFCAACRVGRFELGSWEAGDGSQGLSYWNGFALSHCRTVALSLADRTHGYRATARATGTRGGLGRGRERCGDLSWRLTA
jgi:hypothetical protein